MAPVGMFDAVGPLWGGIIAGVLHTVLGPDHLCALATLSACQGFRAFWFGIQWSGGHFAGMALVCTVLAVVHYNVGNQLIHDYGMYVDISVGLLLVSFGIHFLVTIDQHLDAEGRLQQKTSCEHHRPPQQYNTLEDGSSNLTDGSGSPKHELSLGALAMGVVQGALCPGGLVGIVFIKTYTPLELVCFALAFFVACSAAMGALAAAYGVVTEKFATRWAAGRAIYYGSCALSIILGLALCAFALLGGGLHSGHSHHHHVESH